MTKEEYKKGLESKIGSMMRDGNVARIDVGLKNLPLPPEEEEKEKSE